MAVTTGFTAALVATVCLAPPNALAIEIGSAACKRELQATQQMMEESAALVDSGMKASGAERCKALSQNIDLAEKIRESFARCEGLKARAESLHDADDVIDASSKAYDKWCPPRPGLVRVKATMVTRVTREQLPKPLAAVHRCAGAGDAMSFTNERFDLGRLVALGCPGNPNPTADEIKTRNAAADLLRGEQAAFYVTRDRDGDDPRRLSFPILAADGREAKTDLLFASRVFVGEKLDLISAFWEPAKEGVCRVHAIWRVTDGAAALLLWEEAADCSAGAKTDFKAVLDRR
jgi:hypothetical protein